MDVHSVTRDPHNKLVTETGLAWEADIKENNIKGA